MARGRAKGQRVVSGPAECPPADGRSPHVDLVGGDKGVAMKRTVECTFCARPVPDIAISCPSCGADRWKVRRGVEIWESPGKWQRRWIGNAIGFGAVLVTIVMIVAAALRGF